MRSSLGHLSLWGLSVSGLAQKTIMYHYVRYEGYGSVSGLNFLAIDEFENQIKQLYKRRWKFSLPAGFDNIEDNSSKQVLLTFDDGYREHFDLVEPILNKYEIAGVFFVPTSIFTKSTPLLPNKIQLITGGEESSKEVCQMLIDWLSQELLGEELKRLKSKFFIPGKFDAPEKNFVKRVLQRGIKESDALRFLDYIARKRGIDWQKVHESLYMTIEQLAAMARRGHYIGLHGHDHFYYEDMTETAQVEDLDVSISILKNSLPDFTPKMMGYPYGSYNQNILTLLKERGIKIGYIDNEEHVLRGAEDLTRPRIDCNHFAKIL